MGADSEWEDAVPYEQPAGHSRGIAQELLTLVVGQNIAGARATPHGRQFVPDAV